MYRHHAPCTIKTQFVQKGSVTQVEFSRIIRFVSQAHSQFSADTITHAHHIHPLQIRPQIVTRFNMGHPMIPIKTLRQRIDHIRVTLKNRLRETHIRIFRQPLPTTVMLQPFGSKPLERLSTQYIQHRNRHKTDLFIRKLHISQVENCLPRFGKLGAYGSQCLIELLS